MKKFIFDFNVDAWIRSLEIEAETLEEAEEKFYKMSLYRLVDDGYVEDFNISDVDIEEEDDDELDECVVTEAKKKHPMYDIFEGDRKYFEEAENILHSWYDNEDNSDGYFNPDLSDVLDMLDAATNNEKKSIVAMAIGDAASFVLGDLITGEELKQTIDEWIPLYQDEGLNTVDELYDELVAELAENGEYCSEDEAKEIIRKYIE